MLPGQPTFFSFFSPLFPDVEDLLTVCWVIGIARLDPVKRYRVLMLWIGVVRAAMLILKFCSRSSSEGGLSVCL